MLGHLKRSPSPMHASVTEGTKTPTHPKPSHVAMAGNPSMPAEIHPVGGGDMPLPVGGPGGPGSAGMMGHGAEPAMPHMPKMKMGGGKPGRGGRGGY